MALPLPLLAVSIALALWFLFPRPLGRVHVTAPLILVLTGIAGSIFTKEGLIDAFNAQMTQRIAEVILAVLLFSDALEVRGGFLGRDRGSALRLLFIALPLGFGLAVALGLWLLPNLGWPTLLVIAVVVMPIEFAPAVTILRDRRIPERVRNLLNVEAGYNDGMASTVFLISLVLAGSTNRTATPGDALQAAIAGAIGAVAIGAGVGAALVLALAKCQAKGLTTLRSKRMIIATAPLLSYSLSVVMESNGFIAAFVSGVAFHYFDRSVGESRDFELIDDFGFLVSTPMWFLLGGSVTLAFHEGIPPATVVFCLAALTILRIVPVLIATVGTRFTFGERMLLGWLGPRGTSSIVFGLLALNALPSSAEKAVLMTTVLTVIGSVVMHGIGAPLAARAYAAVTAARD